MEATVVDHVTVKRSCDQEHHGQTATVSTFPVYEYRFNGTDYRVQGSAGITVFSRNRCQIGSREILEISPDSPGQILTAAEQKGNTVMGFILAAFGLLTLVAALMAF